MSISGIEHIFFDLDHTIWDFDTNSRTAFKEMFDVKGLQHIIQVPFEQFHQSYIIHNYKYWDLYSQGLISQEDLRWKRMDETLIEFKTVDRELAKSLSSIYLELLPQCTQLFPYTKEILTYLKNKNYQLHIVSNGFENTQHKKLKYSGIQDFFTHVITSEASNFIKPDKQIFEYSAQKSNTLLEKCIMIGDSPEADLKGAYNAGIPSIYVDHMNKDTVVPYTFRINNLKAIEGIL